MPRNHRVKAITGCVLTALAITGCAGSERALVEFTYAVNAVRGLPPGMKTIYIKPAKVGPGTDPKWADMCATALRALVIESQTRFGTDIRIVDREDTDVTFEEADMAAAGMSTAQGGSGGQLTAAQGAILTDITVKNVVIRGKQRTLSGLTMWGGGGRGYGHGGGDFRTEEVETATRNLTIQMEIKLLDTANNTYWAHLKPKDYNSTERTKASPIFGSSQTEAEMTPADSIIGGLVEKACREFVSELMPCRIDVEEEVVSSGNENCIEGVRLLRAEAYRQAASSFKLAMATDPGDHNAAFGAGVASEASGQYDDALRYYKKACAGMASAQYREARDRMKKYGSRVRK